MGRGKGCQLTYIPPTLLYCSTSPVAAMTRKTKGWELTEENRFGAHAMIHVYRVDPKTVVKLIEPPRLSEAEALRFVRSNTSIPAPEVYDAYIDESLDRGVIVMEYMDGDVLGDIWDDMAEAEQEKITSQLRGYLEELRSIKGDFIGSVDKSPCEDPIFTVELGGFGPYLNEDEFNEGIVQAMELADSGPWVDQAAGFVRALPQHEVVFTHSDFTPRNILVRDGRVVGIIDWEMAGFYPEYWEYIKALYYPDWDCRWFSEGVVDQILPPYPLENAVMMHVHNFAQ